MYTCPRCGSTEFAIDEIEYRDGFAQVSLEVMCRNCGGYQGDLDVNVKVRMCNPWRNRDWETTIERDL